jgi:2'-5' RNA ligase
MHELCIWILSHLFQLHKKVNDALFALGIEPDRRAFRPHITLARCKGVTSNALKPFLRMHEAFETASFRVESYGLFSSDGGFYGPIYKCLENNPLAK